MTEHTVTIFEQELQSLNRNVEDMGARVMQAINGALDALRAQDGAAAKSLIENDKPIDALQRQIEESAILIIAKRQPMAQDLREIVAALRIANDLERVGDLAKNIGKRVLAINGMPIPAKLMRSVEALAQLVSQQVKKVLAAYAATSAADAQSVWNDDGRIDASYTGLFRELLTYMMEDVRNITPCTHLLFTAKNLERIGDHATNIAETVSYMITGELMPDNRPKEDDTTAFRTPTL